MEIFYLLKDVNLGDNSKILEDILKKHLKNFWNDIAKNIHRIFRKEITYNVLKKIWEDVGENFPRFMDM